MGSNRGDYFRSYDHILKYKPEVEEYEIIDEAEESPEWAEGDWTQLSRCCSGGCPKIYGDKARISSLHAYLLRRFGLRVEKILLGTMQRVP